jgi:hypothetical protein
MSELRTFGVKKEENVMIRQFSVRYIRQVATNISEEPANSNLGYQFAPNRHHRKNLISKKITGSCLILLTHESIMFRSGNSRQPCNYAHSKHKRLQTKVLKLLEGSELKHEVLTVRKERIAVLRP